MKIHSGELGDYAYQHKTVHRLLAAFTVITFPFAMLIGRVLDGHWLTSKQYKKHFSLMFRMAFCPWEEL